MNIQTSAEAWEVLSGLLDHGPAAVVWHEGRGCVRENSDTVLELKETRSSPGHTSRRKS